MHATSIPASAARDETCDRCHTRRTEKDVHGPAADARERLCGRCYTDMRLAARGMRYVVRFEGMNRQQRRAAGMRGKRAS